MTLGKLYKIIENRKAEMPEGSYVSSLFKKGENSIVQKVGEEAIEIVIAAKSKNKKKIISEVADLWFHTLVMLALYKITPAEIFKELKNRRK